MRTLPLISTPKVCDFRVDASGYVDFSPHRVLAAMKSSPSHKGCGPDLLLAELLCGRMHLEEKWPLQRKGGRQIDLFKGKGNVQDCDASRGLLLADHMSKIPATIL